jgi:homoserine kinase
VTRSVRVTAPATSANLGPGFDALGLALGLPDVVEATLSPSGSGPALRITIEGPGADDLPHDESHLVARAMRAAFHLLGGRPAGGVELRCRNQVPHGRGLGSSAAAIVTGVLAARALTDGGPERMDDDAALNLAAQVEGHPDNVAPCLLGGFTIAWSQGRDARAVRLEPHPDIRPVVLIPPVAISTQAARGLLPDAVPHADAAGNAARAALLVEALTHRPSLLLEATQDRLHQSYRAAAMPDTLALVGELRSRGLPAVVSGAGPSVLVLTTSERLAAITAPDGWMTRQLAVDRTGTVVETV